MEVGPCMNRFLGVILLLLALALFGAIPVLFILPESFASAVKIRIPAMSPPDPVADARSRAAEMELLRSQAILQKVTTDLGLPQKWAERFKKRNELPPDVCGDILKTMVRVKTVGKTELLAVTVTSVDKYEAAEIANRIAQVRITTRGDTNSAVAQAGGRVEIVERAEPSFRPVREPRRLTLALGLTALVLLGAGVPLLSRKSAR